MVDFNKPLTTRDGREVRIYARDGAGSYPVHGAVKEQMRWRISEWTVDGKFLAHTPAESVNDLINPKQKIKRTQWLNVYPVQEFAEYDSILHQTRQSADSHAGASRIACIPIEIECFVGDGLEEKKAA